MPSQGAVCHFWLLMCKRSADRSKCIYWKAGRACEGGRKVKTDRRTGERGELYSSSSGERGRSL